MTRAELDAFLWLTPFLRIFIPGRAENVLRLQQAYLIQVPAAPSSNKDMGEQFQHCKVHHSTAGVSILTESSHLNI